MLEFVESPSPTGKEREELDKLFSLMSWADRKSSEWYCAIIVPNHQELEDCQAKSPDLD